MIEIEQVALHEATRWRYLNYAMSVITSRALPDVRDGLKPVQRRILYGMYHNLGLRPDGRFRKSAAVVGEVMAKYHPHGDTAIYDAMVRMAQPFALLHPLVDGHGNFGSQDGDSAAAMRYTECRLTRVAMELLRELNQRTVEFRSTYDGQLSEPVVLPARFPQLLVNGSEGIAVGMATRIPPHNLREVIDACTLLIDDPEADSTAIMRRLKGPDFPTGGVILNSREELAEIYETGSGPVRVQGEWSKEKNGRKHFVVVTSIPFGQNKANLVEKMGALVMARRLPQLVDVRDESAEDVRIVLELRRSEDAEPAMAYLFKHTSLQQTFHVNLTALVPSSRPDVPLPSRLDLRTILRTWLDFRLETVRRRFEFELQKLRERIHILKGFEVVFVNLDEAIQIIRESEGRRDSADKLMDRFGLDDVQADAVLDLKLYRLSRLEILEIRQELEDRQAEADRIEGILGTERELWSVVRSELVELRGVFGVPRKSKLSFGEVETPTYRDDAYIVAEDAFVIVTRDGWTKRQSSFSEVDRIRVREGDAVAWLFRASTRSTIAFFTDKGGAYVLRVDSVPATTGYGEPIQKHFHFGDRERVVAVHSFDPRHLPVALSPDDDSQPPWGVVITRKGRCQRFPLAAHRDVSTRTGRRYARLAGDDDGVVTVGLAAGGERVSVASRQGRALNFPVEEVSLLRTPGKGVTAIKLKPGETLLAAAVVDGRDQGVHLVTPRGRELVVSQRAYSGSRGGRGAVVLRRDTFSQWTWEPVIRPCQGDATAGGEE